MFARPVSVSVRLYLDNVFSALLLATGTAVSIAAAFHIVTPPMGLVGVVIFGFGKILCIGAMLRGQTEREIAAFQLGREAGLRSVRS